MTFFFTFNQISSFKKIKQFCDFNVYFYYAKEVEMYEKMIVNLDEWYIVFLMPKIEKTKKKFITAIPNCGNE
jgi:hypothetical protein